MSKAFIDDTNLTNIANSIRSKLGVSDTYLPSEMAGAIQSIPKRKVIDFNITPKTLDNAEQNSLQYVKAYGGTEQRNLPLGYQELEYIESTGTQYITTNLYTQSNNISVKTKVYTPSIPSTEQDIIGNYTPSVDDAKFVVGLSVRKIFVYSRDSEGVEPDGNLYSVELSGAQTLTIDAVYDHNAQQRILTYNGTTVQNSYQCSVQNNTQPIVLLAYYNGSNAFIGKIYYIKYYEDGVIKLDLIPCKNNLGVVGMYDAVSNTFLTNSGTGNFIAGPYITAPTPEHPIDIVCNNGVIRVSRNLWDINKVVETEYYITNEGNVATGADGDIFSQLRFNIEEHKDIVFSWGRCIRGSQNNTPYIRISCYDNSDNFLGRYLCTCNQYSNNQYSCNTLTDTAYIDIRIDSIASSRHQHLEDIQFELGTSATTYHSYGEIYTEGDTETIGIYTPTHKNLFDGRLEYGSISSSVPGPAISSRVRPTHDIIIPAGTYTLSCNNTYEMYTAINGQHQASNWDGHIKTFTVSGTSNTLIFAIRNVSTPTAPLDLNEPFNIQLEIGSQATTYESYYNGGIATCSDLLSLSGYTDTQEILGGVVSRKVGIKVLDGSESWSKYTNGTGADGCVLFYSDDAITNNKLGVSVLRLLNSHFVATEHLAVSTWYSGESRFQTSNNTTFVASHRIYFSQMFTYTSEFTSWLKSQYNAGTPVIIIYPLETPTTEAVTSQSLQVEAGDNILEITQSSLPNLEVECEYFIQ